MNTSSLAAEDYLRRLQRGLRVLPAGDRASVLAEIRGHIAERASSDPACVGAVLATLGDPDALARSYTEEHQLAVAVQGLSPGRLVTALLARATRSGAALVGGTLAALLYAFALSGGLIAVLKPIAPGNVGCWMAPHTFVLGFVAAPGPETTEVLGFWIIPVALAGAVLCYVAATALARAVARHLLRRSASLPRV